jgi:hypothetical protein
MALTKFRGRLVEISEQPNNYELFTADLERCSYVHSENLYRISIRGNRPSFLAELHVTEGRHVGHYT